MSRAAVHLLLLWGNATKVSQQTTPLATKTKLASVAYIIMSWHFISSPCEQGDKTKQAPPAARKWKLNRILLLRKMKMMMMKKKKQTYIWRGTQHARKTKRGTHGWRVCLGRPKRWARVSVIIIGGSPDICL